MKPIVMVTAALVAALVGAGPAHADGPGYVQYLRDHGWPVILQTSEQQAVREGYGLCAQLRDGMSAEDAADQFGLYNGFGPMFVAGAQQELCPDTLR